MADVDVAGILSKVRALGADVRLDGGQMIIIGSVHLNGEQRAWIARHRDVLVGYLRTASAGLPPAPSEEDTAPYTWGQFARVLYSQTPNDVDECDWSWFVTCAGKIARRELGEVK
ncbi:MAG TPA: hypothetical protein VGN60_01945 [Devosia sp.]|nr:hypothetical protein [Devosia sp.]